MTVASVDRAGPGGPSRWFEWRYAAAGLGWGALVGIGTGAVLALLVVVAGMARDGASTGGWLFLPLAVVVGGLWGLLWGSVAGSVAGLVSAVVLPHVGDRLRWWVAFLLPTVVAVGIVAGLLAWDRAQGSGGLGIDAGGLVLLVPPLVGGWLMARTSRSIQRERDRLAGR